MAKASSRTGTKPAVKKTAKKAAKKAVKKRAPVNSKARAVKAAAKKAAKKVPAKKAAKKKTTKRPTAKDKRPSRQQTFLANVLAENPSITSDQLAANYNILAEDVMKMRLFVHEYLKDFNEVKACVRMGYEINAAKAAAKMLFLHSFTQLRLSEVMADLEADAIVSGAQIMAKLWQEANLGESASNSMSRISALKELARIKQMGSAGSNKPVRVSGVMLVPVIEGDEPVTSWEDKAKASQAALKEGAIDV